MKISIVSSLLAVTFLFAAPSLAQNLPSINGTKHFSLVGFLAEAGEAIGDDAWAPYPVLSLYDPVDVSCPVGIASGCIELQGNFQFRLEIPHSLQWAYWKNKESPVSLTATISESPAVNGIHTLIVSALEPAKIETALQPGLYVRDKRFCQESNRYTSDHFAQVIVDPERSLKFNAWETSCDALYSQAYVDSEAITLGCFSEGYAYTAPATVTPRQDGVFELDWSDMGTSRYSLCSNDDQGIYPSATPDLVVDLRRPHADEISYGSRIGMNAALIELSGVDTNRAKLVAQITPVNAYEFCVFYGGTFEASCINEELGFPIAEASVADCSSGIFTNIWGNRRQFIGLAEQDVFDDFSIVDLESGEDITGSIPAGYYSDIELFETLCPSVVAELLSRPSARQKLAGNTYADAFGELDYWQGISIGAKNQNQRRLADLPIWQFATRMRSAVSGRVFELLRQTKLNMEGHFGFAAVSSTDSASLLIDFAQQEIYVCAVLIHKERPVSYRFGTALARGIDGFGSKCPDTLEAALWEYIPLVSADQMVVSEDGESNFVSVPISQAAGADFLGLGNVLAKYACPEFLEEDDPRSWSYKYDGNWLQQGDLGVLTCRIEEAVYSPIDDGIEIVEACGGSGWGFVLDQWTIPRPPKNPQATYFWGETPIKQCTSEFASTPSDAPAIETIYSRNGMQAWRDASSGAVYRVGEYSFSFYTASDAADSQDVLNVAVSLGGRPAASVNLPTAFGGFGAFGIYFMEESTVPTLVVASFAGGAHCCTDYAFLPLTPEPSEVSIIGSFDGDYFDLWDIDRDGNFELARPDIRFPRALGPNLGLWAPPIIYAMQDGVITDATGSDRYRPYLREKIEGISQQCGAVGGWAVGACEGWAATALRLGEYDAAMATIVKRFAAAPKNTTMDGTTFAAFSQELADLFTELGYPPGPAPAEQPVVTSAFDGLTCRFRIKRRVISNGVSGEIAQGTFGIEQGRVMNLRGRWSTLGSATANTFSDAYLSFAPDGALLGELTIYPLYAQAGKVSPSFKVLLDGTSTTSFGGGPEGITSFLVDLSKIEVTVTVYPCGNPQN